MAVVNNVHTVHRRIRRNQAPSSSIAPRFPPLPPSNFPWFKPLVTLGPPLLRPAYAQSLDLMPNLGYSDRPTPALGFVRRDIFSLHISSQLSRLWTMDRGLWIMTTISIISAWALHRLRGCGPASKALLVCLVPYRYSYEKQILRYGIGGNSEIFAFIRVRQFLFVLR